MTNYGLGGLVEDHNDPYGYNEGAPVPPERADLVHSGDIIATVMGEEQNVIMSHYCMIASVRHYVSGWLSDTKAGGATSFFNGVDLVSWY